MWGRTRVAATAEVAVAAAAAAAADAVAVAAAVAAVFAAWGTTTWAQQLETAQAVRKQHSPVSKTRLGCAARAGWLMGRAAAV
jgi:hypothetical protein